MGDAGKRGEYRLGCQLERFDPNGLMLFNVYIPRPDGSTSEIDALLVSESGVYVFENKNYSGWIFGNVKDKMWTQTLNRHSRFRFFNPIRQNAGHVRALEEFLGLSEAAFVPIIVFADKTVLKKVSAGDAIITHTSAVANRLQNIEANRSFRFRPEEVYGIYGDLAQCANAPSEIRQAHIARVRSRKD